MSLGMTLVMLIAGWLAVAAAMLWGVLRISRRHHPHHRSADTAKTAHVIEPKHRHAAAH